jgi:FkbM family methyltransferase
VKIDVGLSHNAPQSFKWIEQDSNLVILGFEPVLKNVNSVNDKIEQNIKNSIEVNERKQIFVIPMALGENTPLRKTSMYITELDSGCSSLLPPKDFKVEYMQETSITGLASILKYFPFDQIAYIDHLKIDAQGFDFDILKGVDDYISRIFAITLEVEMKQYLNSTNNLHTIRKFLRDRGFIPIEEACKIKLPFLALTEDPTFINVQSYTSSNRRDLYLYQEG